jgi:cation diffusion facilitator family transporter
MGFASLQLIFESTQQLITNYGKGKHAHSSVNFDFPTMALLIGTVAVKIILWLYCKAVATHSSTALALAADHENDILANIAAVATGVIANYYPNLYYVDALGAIILSLYIAYVWYDIGREQTEYLVGKTASDAFVEAIKQIAENHHPELTVDTIRAYNFGERFLVELEVVLPRHMTVVESHDIILELQQLIEQLEQVERCFVHVDYTNREEDEHDQVSICAVPTCLHLIRSSTWIFCMHMTC